MEVNFDTPTDLSLESIFGGIEGFDVQAAFHEVIHGVATDEQLALNEKVELVAAMIDEADSEEYRGFVEMQKLAAQVEIDLLCLCDHSGEGAAELIAANETISSFLGEHGASSNERSENKPYNFLEEFQKRQAEQKERDKKKKEAAEAKRKRAAAAKEQRAAAAKEAREQRAAAKKAASTPQPAPGSVTPGTTTQDLALAA